MKISNLLIPGRRISSGASAQKKYRYEIPDYFINLFTFLSLSDSALRPIEDILEISLPGIINSKNDNILTQNIHERLGRIFLNFWAEGKNRKHRTLSQP